MKQLTELKDGQKVLIALTVKKDYKNPYPNELYGNDKEDYFSALTTDLKEVEHFEPEEIYDFNEVMSAKKSEPISMEDFRKKISDLLLP